MSIFLFSGVSAQYRKASDSPKPHWMHNLPVPSNNSFVYVINTVEAKSLHEAKNASYRELLENAALEAGSNVKIDYENVINESVDHLNDYNNSSNEDFNSTVKIDGKPFTIQGKQVAQYWEIKSNGKTYYTTLYARSRLNGKPNFDDVKITTNYGLQGMWRSAICPGWGQLYKGSTLKGGLIMGGTVACIGGIVFTECMRTSYASKINKTHSANLKLSYDSTRRNYATARNICIGALGALYVYNIIDAIVAPGAKRILTSPAGANKFAYQWGPVVTNDAGLGVVAQITF